MGGEAPADVAGIATGLDMQSPRLATIRALASRLRSLALTPLGTLVGTGVVAGICAVVVHQRELMVLAAVGTIIGVGLIWPWAMLRPLRARLVFERDRCREDEKVNMQLVVRNWAPIPISGVWLAGLPTDEPIPIGSVRALGKTELRLSFVPNHRGEVSAGNIRLTCGMPFGLWHPVKPVRVEGTLVVWPRIVSVDLPPELSGQSSKAEVTTSALLASDDTPSGLRPYRRGDLVKLIHHAQTARHDRLIVRELCLPARPAVVIVLDSAEQSYVGAAETFEQAIRIAASLYEKCKASGVNVELLIEGKGQRSAHRSCKDALDQLAQVRTSDMAPLSKLAPSVPRRNGLCCVVTSAAGQRIMQQNPAMRGSIFVLADPDSVSTRKTYLDTRKPRAASQTYDVALVS